MPDTLQAEDVALEIPDVPKISHCYVTMFLEPGETAVALCGHRKVYTGRPFRDSGLHCTECERLDRELG